ncbi:hypothetical protein [Agrococcus sp. ARC_14]|uniref:hypothetical protein n=1 Tax=Agrococcus sp. ARC_14 TaxID=2919927 RepID=UPI001F06F601|nr:hypothetical protein [Agrococcus sp. ARC_14]MCH1884194.1 hypothetical protein [Agrococcus sp. ARC_14]
MTDTVQRAERTERRARTTSIGTWLLVVVVAIALLVIRLPQFIAVAEGSLADATATLGDEALSDAAIVIGSATAIALHAIGILLVAAAATVLERFFGPRALGARLRVGVGGAALAILMLGQQAIATVSGVAAVERGWPMWLAGAIVALSTPLLFPAARAGLRPYARALLVTGVIGGLLCIG